LFSNTWSRQAWLQAMQVLISSARPACAFATQRGVGEQRTRHRDHVGLARREDRLGHLRHVDAVGGDQRHATSPLSFAVTPAKAARGTEVAMVGTRASCQPMPVLMMVAPAASIALACITISSQAEPPSTSSSIDSR
jgi:hypothetical protein